jgi:predicted TIM-barrel fold metal-dependent hydrolase
MGFKGIKLHPDYQGVFFNDIRYKRIVSYATELDMLVLVHAGLDVGMPDPIHCTPKMSDEVIRETESDKLILAHLGGFSLWDEVEELLVGRNIYMDMAVIPEYITDDQFVRIVKKHGADKVLFGSDSPWGGQKESVEWIKRQNITDEEKEDIFWRNAYKILIG